MSNLYLKIMKGSDNSDGFDLIPLPVGAAVSFSNEPPQVTAGDKVYTITNSVYLINDKGVTVTQFTVKPIDKWKVKEVKTSTSEIRGESPTQNPPTDTTFEGWQIRVINDLMDKRLTTTYRHGGAMELGHTRGQIASTFIPEHMSGIPKSVIDYLEKTYPKNTSFCISNGEPDGHYVRIYDGGAGIKYGLHLNRGSLLPTVDKVVGVATDASDIKPNDSYSQRLEDWTPVRDGVSMDKMFTKQPDSFELLGWVVEDISEDLTEGKTAFVLDGGYSASGSRLSGYTTGLVSSTFIEKEMMDIPTAVLDEVFVKYGLHTSVKLTHPEVKTAYLRLSLQPSTRNARNIFYAILLDPNNEEDALKIKDQEERRVKFQYLPNNWLAEDIGAEWGSDRVTVDIDAGYVRGSLYAKFITTKELGLPQETLKKIDSCYPDYTTLLISGGGTRSSYLRFISSTADNKRWVQYARVIADNRKKQSSKDTAEETHPLHPEN